jgi:hypothetical protein
MVQHFQTEVCSRFWVCMLCAVRQRRITQLLRRLKNMNNSSSFQMRPVSQLGQHVELLQQCSCACAYTHMTRNTYSSLSHISKAHEISTSSVSRTTGLVQLLSDPPCIFVLLSNRVFVNWHCRIQNFQRRYDATAVMLVFDAQGLEDFKGPGYHHPDKPAETPQDLECYPIVVSYPIVSHISAVPVTSWIYNIFLPIRWPLSKLSVFKNIPTQSKF